MTTLIPFNRRMTNCPTRTGAGFENFYHLLDDFFTDGFPSVRGMAKDGFRLDIAQTDSEYLIEAEMPGVRKEDIDLSVDGDILSVTVNRAENTDQDSRHFIHRERRVSSMSRSVRLADAQYGESSAALQDGILTVTVPKDKQANASRKIAIA
jgi:HSP20 family protein